MIFPFQRQGKEGRTCGTCNFQQLIEPDQCQILRPATYEACQMQRAKSIALATQDKQEPFHITETPAHHMQKVTDGNYVSTAKLEVISWSRSGTRTLVS